MTQCNTVLIEQEWENDFNLGEQDRTVPGTVVLIRYQLLIMPTITAMELLALLEMQNRSCPNYDGVSFFSKGRQQLFDAIMLVRLRSNKYFDVSVVKLRPISLIHRLWDTCATGESKTESYTLSFVPACYIYNYLFLIM